MGEERRETEFIAVNLYENHMRSAMNRATKGTPVYISGRMSHREYQRQDGTRGCELHVHARDFRILHRAPEGQSYVPPANELPEGKSQGSDQSPNAVETHRPDQDSNPILDQSLEEGLEQDLDFNDPLPLGPEPTQDENDNQDNNDDGVAADHNAPDPTAEDNFENAVETAAFPD